tara:strand:+ start:288 stop:614 length:327 start_codon:yes stop_codon:yes gene_type:complete
MSRKTRVDIQLVAEFDHDNPNFKIRNNQDGHAFVNRIKDLFNEISMDRKVKLLLKKDEAIQSEDQEHFIPELRDLYIDNEIINRLLISLEENTGKIELQVVSAKPKPK